MMLESAMERLETHTDSLLLRWGSLQDLWNDSVRRNFESCHWELIIAELPTVHAEILELGEVMEESRRILNAR